MGMVSYNTKQYRKKAAFFVMLFFACVFLVQGLWAAEAEANAVLNAYNSTDNGILQRRAVRMLSEDARVTGAAVAQWKKDLLSQALDHKNPTVVEAALYQIQMLKLAEFNQRMIDLYHNATGEFANMYDNRVKIGVVNAMAITGKGDSKVFNLFQEILSTDVSKFTYVQGDVLNAIKELNESQYLPMVQNYNAFMKSAIAKKKAAGEHMIKYQVLIGYSTICEDIIQKLRR